MSQVRKLEFPIGEMFKSDMRTINAGECAVLTSLTWTTGAVHSDREFAKTTEFGELILAGAIVVALAAGLLSTTEIYREFERTYGVRVVAALDVNARFKAPVRFGDSIHLEITLTEARESKSRPGNFVLKFEDRVLRQDNVETALMERHILVEPIEPRGLLT